MQRAAQSKTDMLRRGAAFLLPLAAVVGLMACSHGSDGAADDGRLSMKDTAGRTVASAVPPNRAPVRAVSLRRSESGGGTAAAESTSPLDYSLTSGSAGKAEPAAVPVPAPSTTALVTSSNVSRCLDDLTCRERVHALANTSSFGWLRETPSLEDDLTGARFHAVRKVGAALTCDELKHARSSLTGSIERLELIMKRGNPGDPKTADAGGAHELGQAVRAQIVAQLARRCE